MAKLFADAGTIVIVSFISPYRRDRATVRASLGKGEFIEVYVKASLAAAEGRDPKGFRPDLFGAPLRRGGCGGEVPFAASPLLSGRSCEPA